MTSVAKAHSATLEDVFSCTTERAADGTPVVSVSGDLDVLSVAELRAAGTAAVDGAVGGFCVMDLSAVTFLNAAGLAGLVAVARYARATGRTARIVVDANRRVIRPIEVTGLDHSLSLFHTVEEALGSTA